MLSGADWADADLSDLTLVGCTVEGAGFASTVLRARPLRSGVASSALPLVPCADLREAVFEDCHFSAPETGARFAFTRLDGARLRRCDLTRAHFEGCDLYDLGLDACNLTGAAFPRSSFGRTFGRKVERDRGGADRL